MFVWRLQRRVGKMQDYYTPDDFLAHVTHCEIQSEVATRSIIFDNYQIPLDRIVRDHTINNFGYKLVEFCKNNDIYIMNSRVGNDKNIGGTTCKDSSTVDYVLASANFFAIVESFNIKNCCDLFSDVHNPISFSFSICINDAKNNIPGKNQPSVKLWCADKADDFRNNIQMSAVCEIENELNVLSSCIDNICKDNISKIAKDICTVFVNTARETFGMSKHVDNFSNEKSSKPWFNRVCRTARRKYHLAKRLYNRNNSTDNKENLKVLSKQYKRTMDGCIKDYKKTITKKLVNLRSTNPKDYWKILHGSRRDEKCAVSIDDMFQFLKDMNEGCENGESNIDNPDFIGTCMYDDILNGEISDEEIVAAVKKLKNSKAAGYDLIVNEHISSTLSVFLPVYKKFFNIIFCSGFVPDEWLIGIIKPIYKNKGDPTQPENYRPISLLSCLGKLFTSILANRLEAYATETNLIYENQAGFRKNYSTLDHILTLQFLCDIFMKRKKKLFCAFIDFKQAFDTVWRTGLWSKLILNGINGKCFRYIQNMYMGIKSLVKLNGIASNFFECNVGVRQGENLSPFLFSLYINDLENFLLEKNIVGLQSISNEIENELLLHLKLLILFYADDTVIMAESTEDLQNALNEFYSYCTQWKLNVNVIKQK